MMALKTISRRFVVTYCTQFFTRHGELGPLKFQVTFVPLFPTKLWVKHAILPPINSTMIDNEKVSFEKNFFGGPESENLASSRDLIQKIDNLTYQALKSQLRGPWVCHGS